MDSVNQLFVNPFFLLGIVLMAVVLVLFWINFYLNQLRRFSLTMFYFLIVNGLAIIFDALYEFRQKEKQIVLDQGKEETMLINLQKIKDSDQLTDSVHREDFERLRLDLYIEKIIKEKEEQKQLIFSYWDLLNSTILKIAIAETIALIFIYFLSNCWARVKNYHRLKEENYSSLTRP